MKIPYLCHIIDKNGNYSQQIIEGILDLRTFLRSNYVHFIDSDLSYLKNDSVVFKNVLGTSYEIEILLEPDKKEIDGVSFISISNYCQKYNKCRQTLYKAIDKGKIRTIYLGSTRLIEDKKFILERKKRTNPRSSNER